MALRPAIEYDHLVPRLHRIQITDKAIAEVVSATPLVSIPRDRVTRVELVYGMISERPIFLLACGAALSIVGLFGALYILHGGHGWKTGGGMAMGLVFGPWLVWSTLRHGPALLVHTATSTRKLGFGAELEPQALNAFIAEAREAGVDIVKR